MELNPQTVAKVEAYWAGHLGCSVSDFHHHSVRVVSHGRDLSDYQGLFALFRKRAAVISRPETCPVAVGEFLSRLPPPDRHLPAHFASGIGFRGTTVIGPAFIGCADERTLREAPESARLLTLDDQVSVWALQAACPELEWQHGGSKLEERPAYGVFVGDDLATLAAYETWAGAIAHIYIITHPQYRGLGHARAAVAQLARHALAQGLIPQFRTLESNQASMRLAASLGFCRVATSVSARFHSSG